MRNNEYRDNSFFGDSNGFKKSSHKVSKYTGFYYGPQSISLHYSGYANESFGQKGSQCQ